MSKIIKLMIYYAKVEFFYHSNYIKNNKEKIDLVLDPSLVTAYMNCKQKIQDYLNKCVINLGNLFKFYGFRP